MVGVQQQQWRWVAERENTHARKKRKKSDSRFLNPNEPFGLGSIFNRGRKPVFGSGSIPPEAKGGGADENFKLGFLGRVIGFGSISTEA